MALSDSTPGTAVDRASAPHPQSVRPFHLPGIATGRLGNGLALRSMARGHVPLVSVALVLDAGEALVPAGREGVAVLAGDALSGGTRHRSGVDLAEAFERLGAGLRAMTGWDATTVSFTCVAERLDPMLQLVAEVVREPSFPEEEVERIRAEHLASLRQRRMDPGSLADDVLDREVFGAGHPYSRPIAGREETLATLDRDRVLDFVGDRYSPARAGLVVVGDLTPDQVEEVAEQRFGSWGTAAPSPASVPPAAARSERTILVVPRPGAVQSEIRIGHSGPARGHDDEIALRVANTVLGGAFTSRLNLSLRERHGFTYGVHSSFAARKGGGIFSIDTAVQTEVTAAALEEAMAVFGAFVQQGPEIEEVERARDYIAGVFPLRMETTAQLASRLAELVALGLPDDYHHTYRDRVRAVDVEGAREATRRHMHPDHATIVLVGDPDRIVTEVESLGLGSVTVAEGS